MFGSRAFRETVRRVKTRQTGRGWGPKSGINDAPKLLASVALFVGATAGHVLLEAWLAVPDPFVLWVVNVVAGFAGFRVLFFAARRPLLRLLLRAQPWARPKGSQLVVAFWEASLALLQPGNATTSFLERVLPPLPGPEPARAFQQHLDALAPTTSAEAREAATLAMRELLRAGPRVLEQDLGRRAEQDGSDWAWACTWKELLVHDDAQLLARSFYLLDRTELPEGTRGKQVMRAAVLTMRLLDFMKRVGNYAIPCRGLMSRAHPVPKIVPRCVQAFDTLFATSIEPTDTADATLHRYDFQRCSHYIVVLCHGQAVEVPVRDASGARVSEGQLMKLLVTAEAAAKRRHVARKDEGQWHLDTLTWLSWSEWGKAVAGLTLELSVEFRGDGSCVQTRAIDKMFTAALVVALDETLPSWPQAQDALSNRAMSLLLGPSPSCQGAGRWRGGSFCLVVQPDGYAGLCCSLPLAEPWAAAQMWEFALSKERYPISLADVEAEVAAPKCLRLLPVSAAAAAQMRAQIKGARAIFERVAQGTSVRVIHVKSIGWRVLQRLKVAPAALIHLAAQVALYRVQGAVALQSMALDSVPTRLFLGGRSDWVCTSTALVVQFVRVFCDGIPNPKGGCAQARKAKRCLLVQACKTLDDLRRETALGNGVYRFLLALRGSASTDRRRWLLRSLLPSRHEPPSIQPIALCTWLCEVQTDPKTPAAALSLGGGGGFCAAGAASSCRVGVAPVGDSELVVHVSCSQPAEQPARPRSPVVTDATNGLGTHGDNDDEEFVDCAETAENLTGTQAKAEADLEDPTAGCDSAPAKVAVTSADSVAREMERALQDLVDLLQHAA